MLLKFTSSQEPAPKLERGTQVPPETRTSLISLSGSTVVHSFPTLPRPGALAVIIGLSRGAHIPTYMYS
jgi:hypothetical protein